MATGNVQDRQLREGIEYSGFKHYTSRAQQPQSLRPAWAAGEKPGTILHRCPTGPTLVTTTRILFQTKGCSWCRQYPPPMVRMADLLERLRS
jgi:hypothetical protein